MGQNKRIRKLHASIQSRKLRSDFTSALQTYVPEADILLEFPGSYANHLFGMYGDEAPPIAAVWNDVLRRYEDEALPFATVWNELVEGVIDMFSWGRCRGPPFLDTEICATFYLGKRSCALSFPANIRWLLQSPG